MTVGEVYPGHAEPKHRLLMLPTALIVCASGRRRASVDGMRLLPSCYQSD
jgi:hypothetical protein